MSKQKKLKLHMPTWLVITLFVLGVLFLLGGIVGHTDMVIIGCVLTAISIIGSIRDRKLPKWLSITLLVLGLVFLLGDTIGPIIGIVFIVLGIIGLIGNRKPKVIQPKSSTSIAAPTMQHRPVQQPATPRSSSSTPPKKSKSPLAIARDTVFLIIFAPIALIIVVVWFVVATDYKPESKNDNRSQATTQQTAEDKAKQQAEDEAATKEIAKILIDSAVEDYAPKYCETHQQKNIPLPPAEGEQYKDGKSNLTIDDCRAIIRYLAERVGSSPQSLESVSNAKISIGMNRHELIMSWGLPSDINSTHTASGESAQWVYGNPIYGANYVYLDNDVITAIQN